MTPSREPETEAQAETWDRVKSNALRFGLCHRCAAQSAWGHQLGFAEVHPPCEDCAPLVATLPNPRPNGWRTGSGRRGAADPRYWGLNAGSGRRAPGTHGEAVPGTDGRSSGGSDGFLASGRGAS